MSRRRHLPTPHPLTRAASRQARNTGRAARARQAHSLGRAVPAARNTDFVEVQIQTRLVRQAATVVDRDPELVDWVADRLVENQRGPGRPAALEVRTALICFWLLAVTQRNFFVINLATLVDSMSYRVRRELGIDYVDGTGRGRQVSYHQLLRLFHAMADAFDPYGTGPRGEPLREHEVRQRAADLQELVNRLLRASTGGIIHDGSYAVDATLKWAHERPRRGLLQGGHKIPRRGKDGEAGPPLPFSTVIDADDEEDLEAAGLVRDPLEADKRPRSRYDLKTWGGGAAWVGRRKAKGVNKGVFGFALHTATVTDPNVPNVVEGMALTTAPALPAPSIMPVLRDLHDARDAAGVQPLGDVVADGVYSANPNDWQLPLRAMGGTSWFRLHRTNQGGLRVRGRQLFIDGRPCCDCAVYALEPRAFPVWPYQAKQLEDYQAWAKKRDAFEMKPNGGWRPDGGRQFFAVHHGGRVAQRDGAAGGCEHCVDAYGHAVIDPETGRPRRRCCVQRTRKLGAFELGLYQEEGFGTEGWVEKWNPRNRVEGSYGVIKNLALVNWGRDYHHFVGLARETLVAAFALMAYNFHTQRTWDAMERLTREKSGRASERRGRLRKELAMPSAQPTKTMPTEVERNSAAKPARGPKGLEFLGSPRAP